VRLYILIPLVCVLTALGSAQPEPGFDPGAVVRQAQTLRNMSPGDSRDVPGRDDGEIPSQLKTGNPQEPAAADGLLPGAEFMIDTSNALVPAPGSQSSAAIGFDGTNYLVVWEDQRGGGSPDIVGARVTPGGAVLDPAGFTISQATYDQRHPAVAFDGTNYLVVWDDTRRGVLDIYGARVTPGAAVLDPAGVLIAQATNDRRNPAVAFDGTDFLVVWEDDRNGLDSTDVYGARVTTGGTVLDTAGIVVSRAPVGQFAPAVGFDGTNCLVAWHDTRSGAADIFGARVAPDGTVLDPNGRNISLAEGQQTSPAIAFDGTNYLVVWQDTKGPPIEIGIYGARVSTGGTVLDPAGKAIAPDSRGAFPSVAFDGTNYFVAWSEVHGIIPAYYSVWGRRMTASGELLDSAASAVAPARLWSQQYVASGFDGTNHLVLWEDCRNKVGEPDIYGARVTPAGSVIDSSGLLISQSARGQYNPALGFDGSNFLAVWEGDRSGYTDIYGARVTPDGAVLDPQGFVISAAANWQYQPALAFDGTNYLVVWQDYRNGIDEPDIYGARVAPDGTVLDPSGIAIAAVADRQGYPAVSFGDGEFTVVWQDGRNSDYDIYLARVAPDGTVLDPTAIAVAQAAGDQLKPVVGFDGTNYLAVWEDYRNSTSDIYGARVTATGAVLDPNGLAVTQAVSGQHVPALDFDGENFLVAWEDYRRSSHADAYGARVTPAGTVLDHSGIAISTAYNDQTSPAVVFGDSSFLVVWEDDRTKPGTSDIYGTWVSTDGAVVGDGAIVWQTGSQVGPVLAHGAGSRLFLSYEGWAGMIGSNLYNAMRVWGKMDPTPTGVAEMPSAELRTTNRGPTIVRGVLRVPASSAVRGASCVLLDISGREAMRLNSGVNDVSRLSPGVYFVHSSIDNRLSTIAKVVVTR